MNNPNAEEARGLANAQAGKKVAMPLAIGLGVIALLIAAYIGYRLLSEDYNRPGWADEATIPYDGPSCYYDGTCGTEGGEGNSGDAGMRSEEDSRIVKTSYWPTLTSADAAVLARAADNPAISDIAVEMTRSTCYGPCPSYSILIQGDGAATYEGFHEVGTILPQTTMIAQGDIKKLFEAFVAADFLSMKDKYVANVTDSQTTTVTLKLNGREKKVVDYVDGPAELKVLQKLIDEIGNTKRWTDRLPGNPATDEVYLDQFKMTEKSTGVQYLYPSDWKYESANHRFVTKDFVAGKSGAQIIVDWGVVPEGDTWQDAVKGLFGSRATNTEIELEQNRPALSTNYVGDPKVSAISMPMADGYFISFQLKYEASGRLETSYRESYMPVLEYIANRAILPKTIKKEWQTYKGQGITFMYPPASTLVESTSTFATAIPGARRQYAIGMRNGFHGTIIVYAKQNDAKSGGLTLMQWYERYVKTLRGFNVASGPMETYVNGNAALDLITSEIGNSHRYVFIEKGNTIVQAIIPNVSAGAAPTQEQADFVNSIGFTGSGYAF